MPGHQITLQATFFLKKTLFIHDALLDVSPNLPRGRDL